ncbi:DUF4192 domain-containing protein [Occultella kanbiaonis]|uniref:DUF4192 domain-containing protein n=1 Tax=Occultella kanbiaonis TaxID=2675754 RepID=UPI00143DA5B3|nr:DUF4192 domain-containing protein [Occultella kanbiaonis]
MRSHEPAPDPDPDDTEVPTLHLDDPPELLAYLPFRLGFLPHESLVLLAIRADADGGPEIGVVARVDLADLSHPGLGLGEHVLGQLAIDGAVAVFAAVYTESSWPAVLSGRGAAGAALAWWLAQTPLAHPTRTWLVGNRFYRCIECTSSPCCPPAGQRVDDLTTARIRAHLVYQGESYVASRADLLPDLRCGATDRRTAAGAATRERRRRERLTGAELAHWRADMRARWRRLLGAAAPGGERRGTREVLADIPAAEYGHLLAGLEDTQVRDAILLSVAAVTRIEDPADADSSRILEAVFTGELMPDQATLTMAEAALVAVAAHAATARAAPALATLAWLAWWNGDGARADVLVAAALERDPSHRLARLLRHVVDRAVAPGWARREHSATA